MDISKVVDVNELKAFAYDLMRERERLRSNLSLVTQRIEELEQTIQHEVEEPKNAFEKTGE